jgi:hypothetical protein
MASATMPSGNVSVARDLEHRIIQAPRPNPSLQATADHNLKLVEAPVYKPERGQVLLQIKATGICG